MIETRNKVGNVDKSCNVNGQEEEQDGLAEVEGYYLEQDRVNSKARKVSPRSTTTGVADDVNEDCLPHPRVQDSQRKQDRVGQDVKCDYNHHTQQSTCGLLILAEFEFQPSMVSKPFTINVHCR